MTEKNTDQDTKSSCVISSWLTQVPVLMLALDTPVHRVRIIKGIVGCCLWKRRIMR